MAREWKSSGVVSFLCHKVQWYLTRHAVFDKKLSKLHCQKNRAYFEEPSCGAHSLFFKSVYKAINLVIPASGV